MVQFTFNCEPIVMFLSQPAVFVASVERGVTDHNILYHQTI